MTNKIIRSNLYPGMDKPHTDNPGGSMFSPEQLEDKLLEQITMTRGQLADKIHEGVMEIGNQMAEQFDLQEGIIESLEKQVTELRAKVRNAS